MTAPEIIQRIWMPPLWEVGDGIIPTDGQCELDDVSYILATPEALAPSPEVQALIAAETKAMQERVHRLEAIGRRILEGDARGQGVQWSEAMSELEAILKETTHD